MTRGDCKAGMKILFGRDGDVLTRGTVVRVNQKTATVVADTDEGRGEAGSKWRVSFSFLHPVEPVTPAKSLQYPLGLSIKDVRPMTAAEKAGEGWEAEWLDAAVVLELSDGSLIYPSRDPEGNGPGSLFGRTADGEPITIGG